MSRFAWKARAARMRWRSLIVFSALALLLMGLEGSAAAAREISGGAIVPGFNSTSLAANDDGSSALVSLPFSVNFYGTTYNSLYVNNNGNVTFGSPLNQYTPNPLFQISSPMIAAFWADVDTRVGNIVTYGTGNVGGNKAFGVNWLGVGCFNQNATVTNTFQLILIQSPSGPGNFDIRFNYGNIQWDSGQASGGNGDCLGGTAAAAGYTDGKGHAYELPGSGVDNALLSTNPETGLSNHNYKSSVLGRYVFPVRSGIPLRRISRSWSGLVTQNGGPYSGADANFTVPTITCSTNRSSVAIWAGVGGYLPSEGVALVQNGVFADCVNGKRSYSAWWQTKATVAATPLKPISAYPITAGDNMSVSVVELNSSEAKFVFHNDTQNWSAEITEPIPTAAPVATAECIVEAPLPQGTNVTPIRLTNFGTVHFVSCSSESAALVATPTCYLPGIVGCAYGTLLITLDMHDAFNLLAKTVWPTTDGSAFDVKWRHS